jgi:hypothetical protein
MEQKITKEKTKEFIEMNETKKLMFNVLNFSLMKKQLFTLIALLAMLLVGSNVMAQPTTNSGLTPAEARLAVVGSTSRFAVTEATGAGAATYEWDVFEIPGAAAYDVVTANGTEIGTGCQILDVDGDVTVDYTTATIYVRWLTNANGADANPIYCVQVTSTSTAGGSGNTDCSTIRRFFVAVFDYDISVYLSDASGATAEGGTFAVGDVNDICNSWSARVIKNTLTDGTTLYEGDYLTTPNDFTETDNDRAVPAGREKTTETYFTVAITLTGAPANFDLDDLPWRFRFSTPENTGLSLYEINLARTSVVGAVAGFGADATEAAITGANVLALSAVAGWNNNNTVYVSPLEGAGIATTAQYTFQVRSHNLLGDPDMNYNILVDEINLDLQANGDYNDGIKFGDAAVHVAPELAVTKGQSEVRQIKMSPATSTIVITD